MEYESTRLLGDIAPLLERLDRGETLSEEEQAELAAIRFLDGSFWEGTFFGSIGRLTALQGLYLNGRQVSDLRPLSRLEDLDALMLFNTQVSDLGPLSSLKKLKSLAIIGTKLDDISPLKELDNLYFLFCSGSSFREIPRELYERCRIEGLDTTTLSTQPVSIFREGNEEVIRAYYDAPKKAVRESKVIFLGDGGAGKTHTIKRILNQGDDGGIGTDATLGISINQYSVKGESGTFSINFWDFGGQENMHAMHRCFLTERTLYLVVINNRWDLDQQARYWLDNIHSFAPDSPVILAVNLWEGIHKFGLDTNRLHRDYPNLVEVQRYSAKGVDDGNFTALTNLIVEQAEKLDSNAMELPENWAAILEQLRELARKEPVPGEKYKGYIDKKKYLEICTDHNLGGDKNQAIRSWLLEWFNDLGICFSYHRDKQTKEELGTYKVLNPKWLTSAIYILLNHADLDVDNGCVTHSEIRKTLKYPLEDGELNRKDQCDYILPNVTYSPQECEYILQVMRKFGLSYQIVGKKKEFIPALCDSQMPKDLHPTGWGTPISYEFRYSFLPDSVIQRMMIRLYGSKTFTKLWRKGFRFDEPDHGLITVVDAGGPNDILRIDVYSNKENKGRDVMMGLITNIAAVNAELNLKPDQYIIVHGNRGEISAPADMILQAKEQKFMTLPLYSKENGLVEKNVDEILGYTYGETIIEAAQQITKGDHRRLSETVPQIINNYYVYGNIYNSSTPDSLLELLERMAERNVQVSSGFIEYLLEQLRDSSDKNAKKLAEDLKEEKGDGFLKKLSNGIKALPKLATGMKNTLTDGKAAYDAAKPILNAVKLALLTHGPQIAEGAMEFFKLLPPG